MAIGSSAEGWEALRCVVRHLPRDPQFTYVVAHYLVSPHAKMPTDLLARESSLPVRTLIGESALEPSCVYVAAPNRSVIYQHGGLRLTLPQPGAEVLLDSLAAEIPWRSIAILLCGRGPDGGSGLRRFKAAGGRVIAQDPRTAKYPGMPRAAIATGMVDAVLPPEEMGPYLVREFGDSGPERQAGWPRRQHGGKRNRGEERVDREAGIDIRGCRPYPVPQNSPLPGEAVAQRAELQSLLADHFAPPSVLIDEQFRILESFGDVGRYLAAPPGAPPLPLLAMLPRIASETLRAQVLQTLERQKPVRGVARKVQLAGVERQLQIDVFPALRTTQGRRFLVSFLEAPVANSSTNNRAGAEKAAFSLEDLEALENSLDSPLLVVDRQGHLRHRNKDARLLFGLSADHLGRTLVIPGETALTAKLASRTLKVTESGESVEFRAAVRQRHFRVCVRPYGGAAPGAVIVFHEDTRDIRRNEERRQAEAQHRMVAARQEATLNALTAHMAVVDRDGVIVGINSAWKRFAQANGYVGKGFGVGSHYLAICEEGIKAGAPGAAAAFEALRTVLGGKAPHARFEYPCHSQHENRWFRGIVSRVPDTAGGGAVILHTDISEQVRIRELIERQQAAMEPTANAIFITDAEGRIDWTNQAFQRLSGHSIDELLLHTPPMAEGDSAPALFLAALHECRKTGKLWSGEVTLVNKTGAPHTVVQTITPMAGADGNWSHFVVTHKEISEQKRSEAHARYVAEHDDLTGLWNRESFVARLNEAISRCQDTRLAVLLLDLDRFTDTNDALGHLAGDQLVREMADRLRNLLRDSANLARIGGDRFVLIAAATPEAAAIDSIVERLLSGFARPLEVDGRSIVIKASVGITTYPEDGNSAEELLRNAEIAMHRTSADGRCGYRFCDQRRQTEINERMSIERDLSRAMAERELWIAFQPQLCLSTNRIIGAESLLRWSSAYRNRPISTVISVAEESGLILNIGQWVLRESLQQLKGWLNHGHQVRVAVNLSAVQFNQQDVFGIVMELLAAHDIPASCVKAEITETVLLNRTVRVKETLQALHTAGVGLVLDDFGTGYSSLTYLQQFPIEAIKIDASFLRGIGRSGNDEAIVKGIIKLAHSLGQRVVAEGVETQLQLDFLRMCECDQAQGYLLAHPMPNREFEQFLMNAAATR